MMREDRDVKEAADYLLIDDRFTTRGRFSCSLCLERIPVVGLRERIRSMRCGEGGGRSGFGGKYVGHLMDMDELSEQGDEDWI